VLLAGAISLACGEAAYAGWLAFLASPWSLVLHFLFLVGMVLHVWTWFRIMPKTMPRLIIGGRLIPQKSITAAGIGIATVAFVMTLAAAKWVA